MIALTATLSLGYALTTPARSSVRMMAAETIADVKLRVQAKKGWFASQPWNTCPAPPPHSCLMIRPYNAL